jgi:hypothetical protein
MRPVSRWSLLAALVTATPIAHGQVPSRAFADGTVSFRHDVMAVLSKAGCNQGVCHGNLHGKGGLKLSLRGEDPAADFLTLVRGQLGRRVDALRPERSLLLRKPTMATAHEGGQRFAFGSRDYEIIRRWIAQGMPDDPLGLTRLVRVEVAPRDAVLIEPQVELPLRIQAVFADGRRLDVTDLAVYETSNQLAVVSADGRVRRGDVRELRQHTSGLGEAAVRERFEGNSFGETTVLVRFLDQQAPVRVAFVPRRQGFVWSRPPENNFIDRHVFAKLRRLRMNPSPLCDDQTFVRRAHLDLLGVLPTADEAQRFVADAKPDKRKTLVDSLLTRPEFADHWALKWSDLLRNEEKTLDRKGVQNLHAWLRQSIAEGKPLDQIARELVAARGSTYQHPQANWYRANRDPISRAEGTARVFLGVRLQCAKCHNHPFDRWSQDDYYSWAAWFARVQYKVLENRRRDDNDGHEFDGEQIVYQDRKGEVENPRTGQPAAPRLLDDAARPEDDDRLTTVARWVAGRDNPYFARAQVNRIWFHLLGRGLVDPVDDFRATNPPSHPELLDELSADFVAHGFDLRHVIRTITGSRVYQLSAEPNETNRDDEANFARAAERRLAAEPLLDAICQVLETRVAFNGYPTGIRAGQLPGVQAFRRRERRGGMGEGFLKLFGKPPRLVACECERTEEATLAQTFNLVSGPAINRLLTRPDNRLGKLLDKLRDGGQSTPEVIAHLYWSALSRGPTSEEARRLGRYLEGAHDRRAALEDIAWGLLNSHEFLFRR